MFPLLPEDVLIHLSLTLCRLSFSDEGYFRALGHTEGAERRTKTETLSLGEPPAIVERDLNNAVTVDGADDINTATGSPRATPSQEAVSEFRVVNNSFGAEYGRSLGGIVNIVTKSGTNDIYGSIYDYLQNTATNAKSILTLPGFNTLRQNRLARRSGPHPQRRDIPLCKLRGAAARAVIDVSRRSREQSGGHHRPEAEPRHRPPAE